MRNILMKKMQRSNYYILLQIQSRRILSVRGRGSNSGWSAGGTSSTSGGDRRPIGLSKGGNPLTIKKYKHTLSPSPEIYILMGRISFWFNKRLYEKNIHPCWNRILVPPASSSQRRIVKIDPRLEHSSSIIKTTTSRVG